MCKMFGIVLLPIANLNLNGILTSLMKHMTDKEFQITIWIVEYGFVIVIKWSPRYSETYCMAICKNQKKYCLGLEIIP